MNGDKISSNTEPHKWQAGDLGEYEYDGETIKAIRLETDNSIWINEKGVSGFMNTGAYPVRFLGRTGMHYMYGGYPRAASDFKKGVFDQYFKVAGGHDDGSLT